MVTWLGRTGSPVSRTWRCTNGTIDLFAASDKAIHDKCPNHTSAGFIEFLDKINREVPVDAGPSGPVVSAV